MHHNQDNADDIDNDEKNDIDDTDAGDDTDDNDGNGADIDGNNYVTDDADGKEDERLVSIFSIMMTTMLTSIEILMLLTMTMTLMFIAMVQWRRNRRHE